MISVINRYETYHNSGESRVLAKETSSGYQASSRQHLDEWYTPANIVELVLQVLEEIDLDPCAEGNRKIPARKHYTVEKDGLQHEWLGRLFINPPLSHADKWIAKLQSEVLSGRVSEAIALCCAVTDTDWLNSVLKTQPICFWKERIIFLDTNYQPNLPATQSYCLVYWGNNQQRFKEVFEQHGIVYIPVWKFTENNSPNSQQVQSSSLTSDTNSAAPVESKSQTVLPVSSTSSTRRSKGKGTGRIHWRTVTKRNGKQYEQPWYDWQLNIGQKTISKSTYIPKHLFSIILELEINKAPVNEILGMLGIIL